MSPRLAVLSAAAVTAALPASPALAQSGGQTLRFREVEKGSHFKFVDAAPTTKFGKEGPKFVSAGDQFVFSSPLANATGRIGELRATCVATVSSRSFTKAHFFCTGAFRLRTGTLFLSVTFGGEKVTKGAVTGGTGAYTGARGSFTSTDTKTTTNDVVTLLP